MEPDTQPGEAPTTGGLVDSEANEGGKPSPRLVLLYWGCVPVGLWLNFDLGLSVLAGRTNAGHGRSGEGLSTRSTSWLD